jgi:signal transduction histidine kinase
MPWTHHHVVQFYDDDEILCERVARYLGDGLTVGECALVIATEDHRASIARHLTGAGHHIDVAIATGQLVMLDAEATLQRISVAGKPSRERCFEHLGATIDRLHATSNGMPVRAYGEMVDLLWRAGERASALALETYWNELARTRKFALLCAYVMASFYKAADLDSLGAICAAHSEAHAPEGLAGSLVRELAHRKELEAALRDSLFRERAAREQAERSLRFNEMFAGMLGHDLRNPLSTITMGASHISRHGEGDKARATAQRIAASAERMGRMVDQLLDLTKLRVGNGIGLARARIDLAELAHRIADEIRAVHPQASIAVETHGETDGAWDADRLEQLASNLLHNAVVHGAPERPVTVAIDGRDSGEVVMTVHNDGAIPDPVRAVLFEPFRSGREPRARSRGLGLGLYITQQIVAAHGGKIDVASASREGTTFRVTLPR